VNSLVYAEAFMDEKLPQFIAGTVHAVQFYGGITKYFIPDNLRTAITKHTKDELVLQSAFSDLEDFYDAIILPPPAYKPRGKATVENHVKYLVLIYN
jgi:transposase